jgi:hypothetical protein
LVKSDAYKHPDKKGAVRWAEILTENARLERMIVASIRAKATLSGARRHQRLQRAN